DVETNGRLCLCHRADPPGPPAGEGRTVTGNMRWSEPSTRASGRKNSDRRGDERKGARREPQVSRCARGGLFTRASQNPSTLPRIVPAASRGLRPTEAESGTRVEYGRRR